MKLIYKDNEYDVKYARQSRVTEGYQFLFNLTLAYNIESLWTQLEGIEEGFNYGGEIFVGYKIVDIGTTWDEEGHASTNIVMLKIA